MDGNISLSDFLKSDQNREKTSTGLKVKHKDELVSINNKIKVDLTLIKIDNSQIEVEFNLPKVVLKLTCVRCLEEFDHMLSLSFNRRYGGAPWAYARGISPRASSGETLRSVSSFAKATEDTLIHPRLHRRGFLRSPTLAEEGKKAKNEEMLPIKKGDKINIYQPIKEEIISNIPPKAICKKSCKGLCQICGQNLNKETCQCQPQTSKIKEFEKAKEKLKNNN